METNRSADEYAASAQEQVRGQAMQSFLSAAGQMWTAMESLSKERTEELIFRLDRIEQTAGRIWEAAERIDIWCGSRQAELQSRLKASEEKLNITEEQLNRKLEDQKELARQAEEKLEKWKGDSDSRDIYEEFLKRKELPMAINMSSYETFIISVCAGGIEKIYAGLKEKITVSGADRRLEEYDYLLDRCIEVRNRVYPKNIWRRQEAEEAEGEPYSPESHVQVGSLPYGNVKKVLLRGIISSDRRLIGKPVVEVE